LIDLELTENSIIEVKNVGTPFKGGPEEMVDEALAHIVKRLPFNKGILPVICQSSTGTDKYGIYTTGVIFQAVFTFPY
jgi:hypothetical protein